MSLTTYSGVQTAVGSWLNRSDLTSYIPDFIDLAHSEIQSEVRHWRMLNRATVTLDGQYTEHPDDFVEAKYVILKTTPIHKLTVVTPERIIEVQADHGYSTGRPDLVAFGEEIMVAPTPADEYTMEMLYYQRIPILSASGSTNWVLTYFPGLYLFGALKEAAPFLHEDTRVPTWEAKFQSIMAKVRKDHAGQVLSGHVESLPGRTF